MIQNVPPMGEVNGTIARSYSEIDGPTPNGQNTPPQNDVNIDAGFNAISGRSWANLPNGQILSVDVDKPKEE